MSLSHFNHAQPNLDLVWIQDLVLMIELEKEYLACLQLANVKFENALFEEALLILETIDPSFARPSQDALILRGKILEAYYKKIQKEIMQRNYLAITPSPCMKIEAGDGKPRDFKLNLLKTFSAMKLEKHFESYHSAECNTQFIQENLLPILFNPGCVEMQGFSEYAFIYDILLELLFSKKMLQEYIQFYELVPPGSKYQAYWRLYINLCSVYYIEKKYLKSLEYFSLAYLKASTAAHFEWFKIHNNHLVFILKKIFKFEDWKAQAVNINAWLEILPNKMPGIIHTKSHLRKFILPFQSIAALLIDFPSVNSDWLFPPAFNVTESGELELASESKDANKEALDQGSITDLSVEEGAKSASQSLIPAATFDNRQKQALFKIMPKRLRELAQRSPALGAESVKEIDRDADQKETEASEETLSSALPQAKRFAGVLFPNKPGLVNLEKEPQKNQAEKNEMPTRMTDPYG